MGSVLAKCRIGCQIAVLAVLGLAGMTVVAGINLWGTAKVDLSNGVVAATGCRRSGRPVAGRDAAGAPA